MPSAGRSLGRSPSVTPVIPISASPESTFFTASCLTVGAAAAAGSFDRREGRCGRRGAERTTQGCGGANGGGGGWLRGRRCRRAKCEWQGRKRRRCREIELGELALRSLLVARVLVVREEFLAIVGEVVRVEGERRVFKAHEPLDALLRRARRHSLICCWMIPLRAT